MAKWGKSASGSSLALALALGLGANQAAAQEVAPSAPAKPAATTSDDIVITGSVIRGIPEDAALPVSAVTADEIKKLGTPTNLELVRQLSQVGMIQGEFLRLGAAFPAGANSINLRNLTSARSVALLNGIRLPNQTGAVIGGFQNTSFVPNYIIDRIDVLTDGGAVTYGADAVGGVINFITKRNFDGLQAQGSYRFVPDSDGDYSGSVLWGNVGSNSNVMIGAGYEHRSNFRALDRDWTQLPYLENNNTSTWSQGSGTYTPQTAAGSTSGLINTGAGPGTRYAAPGGSTGASLRDYGCTNFNTNLTFAGFGGSSAAPAPACYYHITAFDHLANDDTKYNGYGEVNFNINDNLKFHFNAGYTKQDVTQYDSPSPSVAVVPFGSSAATTSFTTYGASPYVQDFVKNYGGFTSAQYNTITGCTPGCVTVGAPVAFNQTGAGKIQMTPGLWREFSVGGNPFTGEANKFTANYTDFRTTAGLRGGLGTFLGFDLGWEGSFTFDRNTYKRQFRDIYVERLQKALDGFGGPDCSNTENDVAANRGNNSIGCYYVNPFYSSVAMDPITGTAMPAYTGGGPGRQAPADVINWLWGDRFILYTQKFAVTDIKLQGDGGIELPGGPVSWAVGGQFRWSKVIVDVDDGSNQAVTPCAMNEAYVGLTVLPAAGAGACLNKPGPWVGGTTGENLESNRNFPVYSYFGEVRLPIFDSLTVTAAVRTEKFISDITDKDNLVTVPSVSGQWNVTDNFYLRGSWGKTFSNVDPPIPGFTSGTATITTDLGGGFVPYRSYRNQGIQPESGVSYNAGIGGHIGGLRGRLDYFHVRIDDYVDGLASTDLFHAAFSTAGTHLVNDCSSPLFAAQTEIGGLAPIQLSAPCTPATTIANVTQVNYLATVNAGSLLNTGLDGEISYTFDEMFGGSLQLGANATYNLKYQRDGNNLFGQQLGLAWDGVGFLNQDTGKNSQVVPKYRGQVFANYHTGPHNFRVTSRYIKGPTDDRTDIYNAAFTTNTNPVTAGACVSGGTTIPADAGQGRGAYDADCNIAILGGKQLKDTFITDFTYNVDLPWQTNFALTVNNVFDQDPPFARFALSYEPFTGEPLGRNVNVRLQKKF